MLPVIVVAFHEFWVAWQAAERKQQLDCEQAHEGDGYDGDESNGAQNADEGTCCRHHHPGHQDNAE